MTELDDQVNELVAIRDAIRAGKRMQFQKYHSSEDWRDFTRCDAPRIDTVNYRWRVVPDPPEKKVRAWNAEECAEMVGTVIRSKKNPQWCTLICGGGSGDSGRGGVLLAFANDESSTPQEALDEFTMLDGSPCGVVVDNQ